MCSNVYSRFVRDYAASQPSRGVHNSRLEVLISYAQNKRKAFYARWEIARPLRRRLQSTRANPAIHRARVGKSSCVNKSNNNIKQPPTVPYRRKCVRSRPNSASTTCTTKEWTATPPRPRLRLPKERILLVEDLDSSDVWTREITCRRRRTKSERPGKK